MNRLRELDFLRGIAILLVLLRHIPLFTFTENMGWIGVDLFFVLSGFLVSGLLFREYIREGDVRVKLFLIRRGFKIYPIYYLFYIPYLLLLIRGGRFKWSGFLSEMTFTQNYLWGFGYAYAGSWSLAVEEHFYFGLSILLWMGLKYKKIKLNSCENQLSIYSFDVLIIFILIVCLVQRLIFNALLSAKYNEILFTATQFRIDSLLMGVLISYYYYFHFDVLKKLFQKHQYILLLVFILGLSWTPYINPVPSFFVKTIGFTLLYISFGILLLFILLKNNVNQLLDKIFTATVVDVVSRIGFCSYSIYIIHILIIRTLVNMANRVDIEHNRWLSIITNKCFFFILATGLSIIMGMLITYKIERYFLKLRNIYFPSRVSTFI